MAFGHVNMSNRQIRKRIQILLFNGLLKISIDLFGCQCAGGDERARTADPLLAKQVLSQLSYIPWATAYEPCLWRRPRRRLPPRAKNSRLRGRLTDLERPEEGERQD